MALGQTMSLILNLTILSVCIVGIEQDEVVSDQYSELGTEPERAS